MADYDLSDLVAQYQVLCTAISYWEPMNWQHPALQKWLSANGFATATSPWQLPPSALWVVVQNLERKLNQLQTLARSNRLGGGHGT